MAAIDALPKPFVPRYRLWQYHSSSRDCSSLTTACGTLNDALYEETAVPHSGDIMCINPVYLCGSKPNILAANCGTSSLFAVSNYLRLLALVKFKANHKRKPPCSLYISCCLGHRPAAFRHCQPSFRTTDFSKSRSVGRPDKRIFHLGLND